MILIGSVFHLHFFLSFTVVVVVVFCCCFSIDIDECIDNMTCHLNATCEDQIGSYECSCNSGFNGDGFNCQGESVFI